MAEISEQKRLGDRIVALTEERDAYILKQQVWEAANDELRSADIRLRSALQEIDMECQGGSEHWDEFMVLRKIRGIIKAARASGEGK